LISGGWLVKAFGGIVGLTSNCANRTAATVMIDNGGIAFDNAIHREVASIAGIGDLPILERLDSSLNCVHSCAAVLQYHHSQLCGTALLLV
jgi:hypothetical protein